MILCHKHKFIYVKAQKVAGTSLEQDLSQHTGDTCIVTRISEYDNKVDENNYKSNHKNSWNTGLINHSTALEIKQLVGKKIWDNYFTFSCIRNPWDKVISYFYYLKQEKRNCDIEFIEVLNSNNLKNEIKYIRDNLPKFINAWRNYIGKNFYFDEKGKPLCDFYIRYENLIYDYEKVCNKLKISRGSLLRLKSKPRKHRIHYSKYYNNKTKKLVRKIFKNDIDVFGYKFET